MLFKRELEVKSGCGSLVLVTEKPILAICQRDLAAGDGECNVRAKWRGCDPL